MDVVRVASRVHDVSYSSLTAQRAEVIKIEHPIRGDDTRAWGPPYATYTEKSSKQGSGESAYFMAVRLRNPQYGIVNDLTRSR